ncbi:MAG: FG-GAP-like repeat-containing protein, partial [Bacteroidota bacterium]
HDNRFPNILYQNDGKGRFTDVSEASGTNFAGFGMGVDIGDINHDGWLDIYITNLWENTLYLNKGDKTFLDISAYAGVEDLGMGWGIVLVDVNNDGWQDIYVANGKVANDLFPHYPNILYQNDGTLRFRDISPQSATATFGNSYGLASADLNQDGKLDLVVANFGEDEGNELLRNVGTENNHWVRFSMEGISANRMGIGTRIAIKANDVWQTDEVTAGSSWASQSSGNLHFGLSKAEMVDSVIVFWPSGIIDTYQKLEANKVYHLLESSTTSISKHMVEPFSIYPNPVRSGNSIQINLKRVGVLRLYSITGKLKATQKVTRSTSTQGVILSTKGLEKGMYVIRINGKSQQLVIY